MSEDLKRDNEPDDGVASLRPTVVETVLFVGLGLVGGSLAKATRHAFPDAKITGIDREMILEVAREHGVIDDGGDTDHAAPFVREADLVVISLPVLSISTTLDAISPFLKPTAVVTDTGSTKMVVDKAARRLALNRFIGSHPMAGKAQGGLAHADADLVKGATWFLCAGTHVDADAIQLLRTFVRALGARPVEIDAAEHDRAVAMTSHLPHVIANALAELVLDEGALEAAGGSLKDMLCVAGAPADSWSDTLATNDVAVREALEKFIARLSEIKEHLDDKDRVRALFGRGRACRERVRGPQ